jgi:hypothetical protein
VSGGELAVWIVIGLLGAVAVYTLRGSTHR